MIMNTHDTRPAITSAIFARCKVSKRLKSRTSAAWFMRGISSEPVKKHRVISAPSDVSSNVYTVGNAEAGAAKVPMAVKTRAPATAKR